MDFEWLPKDMTTLCSLWVKKRHEETGASLPKILWHPPTMAFMTVHKDLFGLLGAASAAFKFMILCSVAAILAAVLGALVNGWIALAVIPAVVGVIHCKRAEKEFYTTLAAIILAMESLADNVGGCAERYPAAALEARRTLDKYLPNDRTRLLNLYLPGRSELTHDLFAALTPAA